METAIEEIKIEILDNFCLRGLLYKAFSACESVPVCICIHGLGVDINTWQFVAPKLQACGISVLCLDLRGHGLSDSSSLQKLNPKQMARDIYIACKKLDISPTYLLAASFGNHVGLQLLHQYGNVMDVAAFYAVTPVWTGNSKPIPKFFKAALQTIKFLYSLGSQIGFCSSRKYQRRDHTQYANFSDMYMPRFIEEAASISWSRYARLLVWLRLQAMGGDFDWSKYAHYPIQMIAAIDEGLWDNKELESIHKKTGWPLDWLKMNHISLSTKEKYADELMRVLDKSSFPAQSAI